MKYNRVYDAVLSTPIGPADVTVGESAFSSRQRSTPCQRGVALAGIWCGERTYARRLRT
jgi:hypothetical protein